MTQRAYVTHPGGRAAVEDETRTRTRSDEEDDKAEDAAGAVAGPGWEGGGGG